MDKIGVVIKIENGIAQILASKGGSCGGECLHCSSSCSPTENIIIESKAVKDLKVGDKVAFEMNSKGSKLLYLYMYIIPSILLVLSVIILSFFLKNEGFIAIVTLIIIFLYFLVASKIKKNINLTFRIVRFGF